MMGSVVGVNMEIGATPQYDGALALSIQIHKTKTYHREAASQTRNGGKQL